MRDGFLQTIRECPDDTTPRLVYADWLDDRGETLQAEFIRAECEIGRLQAIPGWVPSAREIETAPATDLQQRDGKVRRLKDRTKGLIRSIVELLNLDSIPGEGLVFYLGLLDEVTCTAEAFLKNAETIHEGTPCRKVKLTMLSAVKPTYVQIKPYCYLHGYQADSGISADFGMRDAEMYQTVLRHYFPGIEFQLPQFGPSPLTNAFPAWRDGEEFRQRMFDAFRDSGPVLMQPGFLIRPMID